MVLRLLLSAATILLFLKPAAADGPDDTLIAYAHAENLHVITGTGRSVLKLPAKRSAQQDYKDQGKLALGFLVPDVHPDQTRVAAVRCQEYDPNELPFRGFCDVAVIPLNGSAAIRSLYTPAQKETMHLDAPAWSPDGRTVAFLEGPKKDRHGEVVIVNVDDGRVMKRIPVPYLRGINPRNDDLRFSRNGARLFIWATRAKEDKPVTSDFDKDIGIIDIDTAQVRWLGQWVPDGKWGQRWQRPLTSPQELAAQKALRGPRERKIDTLYEKPLGWSADGQYFFVYKQKMGIPAKGWIERYDTNTQTGKSIKTVWWSPFAE